jgi:hypothetical protein
MFKTKSPGKITVSDPVRVVDGMSTHVKYRVNMEEYTGLVVTRRYKDFLWLSDILRVENDDCVVPEFPKKQSAG